MIYRTLVMACLVAVLASGGVAAQPQKAPDCQSYAVQVHESPHVDDIPERYRAAFGELDADQQAVLERAIDSEGEPVSVTREEFAAVHFYNGTAGALNAVRYEGEWYRTDYQTRFCGAEKNLASGAGIATAGLIGGVLLIPAIYRRRRRRSAD